MLKNAMWDNVQVMKKDVTAKGKNMIEVAWMGGAHAFFDPPFFADVAVGDTVTIAAEAQEGQNGVFVRNPKLLQNASATGADASRSRSRATA